jgi:hypothetical protein
VTAINPISDAIARAAAETGVTRPYLAAVCCGGACSVDPLGTVLAGPLWDREGIVTAEIIATTVHGGFDFDPVGYYSLPDVFHLLVDQTARSTVTFVDGSPPTTPSQQEF